MAKNMSRTFLLTAMLVFAWACAGPRYFDLQTEIPETRDNFRVEKFLLIDDVEVNATYRDYRIVCRETPFQVTYHSSASWSKSPDELIEDAIVLFWKKRAIFKKVNAYGSSDDPDWKMKIYIGAMEKVQVQKKWFARLALEMEISDVGNNEILLVHSFDRTMALEKKRIAMVPQKISAILHEELLQVEAKLQKLNAGAKEDSGADLPGHENTDKP